MSRSCPPIVFGVIVLSLPLLCAACGRNEGGETARARASKEPRTEDQPNLERRAPEASSLGISGRSPLFARGFQDGTILVREGRDGEHRRTLAAGGSAVTALSFSPDGVYLAAGHQDGTVRLWDPRSGRQVRTLHEHSAPVDALTFSPEVSRLVSVGRDSRLILCDIPEGRDVQDLASLAGQAHTAHWVLAILPAKTEVLPPSVELNAAGPEPNASAETAAYTDLAADPTEAVLFRPARVQLHIEHEQRSTLVAGSPTATEVFLFDQVALAQPEREPVLTVALSLDRAALLGDHPVSRVSFRLSPCNTAGAPCPAPELTLASPRDTLMEEDAARGAITVARRSQSFSSAKVIDPAEPLASIASGGEAQVLQITAFENRLFLRREVPRHSYTYYLSLLSVSGAFATRQARRLRESVRSRPEEGWFHQADPAMAESLVAFSRDGSVVSWASPTGLIHVYDLRRNRLLQVVALARGAGRGEWRAHVLGSKRVKNVSSSGSRWEIRGFDRSFLLVRVFLENRLRDRSSLPLSGVYLRSGEAFYPAAGVLPQGLHRRPGDAEVSMPGHGEGARVFVFVVPHSVQDGLTLHILDLEPIELVD